MREHEGRRQAVEESVWNSVELEAGTGGGALGQKLVMIECHPITLGKLAKNLHRHAVVEASGHNAAACTSVGDLGLRGHTQWHT